MILYYILTTLGTNNLKNSKHYIKVDIQIIFSGNLIALVVKPSTNIVSKMDR